MTFDWVVRLCWPNVEITNWDIYLRQTSLWTHIDPPLHHYYHHHLHHHHLHVVCLMTGPRPFPKRVLQRVRSNDFSFNFQYLFRNFRSYISYTFLWIWPIFFLHFSPVRMSADVNGTHHCYNWQCTYWDAVKSRFRIQSNHFKLPWNQ